MVKITINISFSGFLQDKQTQSLSRGILNEKKLQKKMNKKHPFRKQWFLLVL